MAAIKKAQQTAIFGEPVNVLGGQPKIKAPKRGRGTSAGNGARNRGRYISDGAAVQAWQMTPGWGEDPDARKLLPDSVVNPPSADELLNTADYRLRLYKARRSTALWLAGAQTDDHWSAKDKEAAMWDAYGLAVEAWRPDAGMNHDEAGGRSCPCLSCLYDILEQIRFDA